jgi:hypothetical protein
MSDAAVELLNKIASDPAFRDQLKSSQAEALAPYTSHLEPAELQAFQAMSSAITPASNSTAADAAERASFKEKGAAALSIALVVICIPVIVVTLIQVGATPATIKVGDAVQVVDPFAQAKEVLAIVFPLLTAVVTFWLGVAVEGRRADTNGKTAAEAKAETATALTETSQTRDRERQAATRENDTKVAAVDAIGQVEGALAAAQATRAPESSTPAPGSSPDIERRGGAGSGSAPSRDPSTTAVDLEQLQDIVSAAKRRLLA